MDELNSLRIYRGDGGPGVGEVVLVAEVKSQPGISATLGYYALLPDLDLSSSGAQLIDHAFQRAYQDEPVAEDLPGLEAAAFERARGALGSLIDTEVPGRVDLPADHWERIAYQPAPSAIRELVSHGRLLPFFQRIRADRWSTGLRQHLAELGIEPAAGNRLPEAARESSEQLAEPSGPEVREDPPSHIPVPEETLREMRDELERLRVIHDDALLARNYALSAPTGRQILECERELARAENTEHAVRLPDVEWKGAIEPPTVWAHDQQLWMICGASRNRYRTMKFNLVCGYRWTRTSDHMEELPLHGHGFEPGRAMEVINSKWIGLLKTDDADSPHWAGVHHYVFPFWDSIVEVIARSFEWNSEERSLAICMAEAMNEARRLVG